MGVNVMGCEFVCDVFVYDEFVCDEFVCDEFVCDEFVWRRHNGMVDLIH